MNHYLFEDPSAGILLAVVLEFLLVMTWAIRKQRFHRPLLLLGPALAGLFLLLDRLVQTNREALEDATRRLVQAAEQEDADTIISLLSDSFRHGVVTKEMTEGILRYHLRADKPLIESNRITRLEVTRAGDDGGSVELTVMTNTDQESVYGYYPLIKTRWRFDFVRDPDKQFRLQDLEMTGFGDDEGINVFRKGRLDSGLY
ncbi:MAG: hypothetical protein JW810_03285 [Sedimentisphaerales bacterium]|nr:hypothetical protein [Sedimentisphaerales bacterium]